MTCALITRRRLLAAAGAAAVVATFRAGGQQQPALRRIAYLANDPSPRKQSETFKGFVDQLRQLGWVEGRNIEILDRTSSGRDDAFPGLVQDVLAARAEIIVAGGSAATRAAKAATESIPIVFGSAASPVEQKLVASLARPGANVTGLSLLVAELGPKRLQLIKELLPNAKQVARLYDASSTPVLQPGIIQTDAAAAEGLGLTLRQMPVADVAGIEATFAAAARSRIDAIILTAAGLFVGNRERIAKLTLRYGLPTMGPDARFTQAGALVSYGEDFVARYRRAAMIVDKILRGVRPADIPVEQPATLELVVNEMTAKTLGIEIPSAFAIQVNRFVTMRSEG